MKGAERRNDGGWAGGPGPVTMGGQGREGVGRSVVLRWCWRRWEPASVVAPGEGTALPLMVLITMGGPGGDDSGVVAAAGCHRGTMGMRLATEVRGRRRAAVIRRNVQRHAWDLHYSTSLVLRLGLSPWAWSAGPWMRSDGPHGAGRLRLTSLAGGEIVLEAENEHD